MATSQHDVVVIGAGPAGYVCAIRLAQNGRKVTVIDKAEVGGVCLNRGCIPSKALIYAGGIFDRVSHHADELGIEQGGKPLKGLNVNMTKLKVWKDGVVAKLTGGVGQLLKANGCTVIAGDAKFTGPKTLEVKTAKGVETIQFNACVIATGSRPTALPGFTVDQKKVLDSTGALDQTSVPKSLLCIGGGYIGLELGTFFSKVGTEVTVVEGGPGLLGGVDPDLAKVVHKKLEKRGVKVYVGHGVKGMKDLGAKGVEVTFEPRAGGKAITETFEKVLVTIGRTPNHEGIGLDKAGVKLDARASSSSMPSARRTWQASTPLATSPDSRSSRTRARRKASLPLTPLQARRPLMTSSRCRL